MLLNSLLEQLLHPLRPRLRVIPIEPEIHEPLWAHLGHVNLHDLDLHILAVLTNLNQLDRRYYS